MLEKYKALERELNQELKRVFPKGKEITFKRGNMREYHNATILIVGMFHGFPELYIENTFTGIIRWIFLDDVAKMYWDE